MIDLIVWFEPVQTSAPALAATIEIMLCFVLVQVSALASVRTVSGMPQHLSMLMLGPQAERPRLASATLS